MKMVKVKSSNIKQVGYSYKTHILAIQFKDDSVYLYARVPEPIYMDLKNAESVGAYFSRHIRSVYKYDKFEL